MAEWDDLGFVYSSRYRKKVMEVLAIQPCTPTIIAAKTKIRTPHVSRALSELEDHGLVVCLTPQRRRGRIYALTEKGQRLAEKLSRFP